MCSSDLDATFLSRDQRQLYEQLAQRRGAGFAILDCSAGIDRALERIRLRQQQKNDPSEADGVVLAMQLERLEPLSIAEQRFRVAADDPEAFRKLAALAAT